MFFFDKNKTKEQKVAEAKEAAKLIIMMALENNPKYKAPIAAFCSVAGGNISEALADAVAKKLDCKDDPAAMQLIKMALVTSGFYGFDEPSQLEIIKEICGIVS